MGRQLLVLLVGGGLSAGLVPAVRAAIAAGYRREVVIRTAVLLLAVSWALGWAAGAAAVS